MANAIITVKVNPATVTNAKLVELSTNFEQAVHASDVATGLTAYYARGIQQLFEELPKGGKIDNYKSYVEFMERHYGVKRSQAFNLAKAGSFLVMKKTDDTTYLVDKWSDAAGSEKSFTNTTLVRMAEFIGRQSSEKSQAKVETTIVKCIEDGKINQDMSFSQIQKKLADELRPVIETTATVNEPESNQVDSNNDETSKTPTTPETPKSDTDKKTVTAQIVLTKEEYFKLKTEMIQFTAKKANEGKCDAMVAFILKMDEQFK